MKPYHKNTLFVVIVCSLFLLPSAINAPERNPNRRIDYLNDYQVYIFEKVGIDENNGRMVKHRDRTGGVTTISWDKKDD